MFPAKPLPKLERLLRDKTFKLVKRKEEYSDSVAEGYVIRTNPNAGAQKKEQSRIDLIVSKGPNSFEMPNYVGETRAKAEGGSEKYL